MTAPHFAADRLEHLTSPAGDLRLATYEWHPRSPTPPGVPVPDACPRAVIVLAHGYGEHANRHAARPIGELVSNGYLVAALDHRGHGRSDGPRATCERFDDFTDDYAAFVRRTRARYPDAPIYALGHSMGGLIALRYALTDEARDYDIGLAGLIVAGVALHPIPAIPGPLRPLIKNLVRRVARVAPDLPVTPPCEDRCRPGADDLCYSGPTPARMAFELLAAGDDAIARASALTCPLLVLHGARDHVTGLEGAAKLYERVSSPDKTLVVFERLRHQVLTPKTSPARIDLLRWLDERSAPQDRRPRSFAAVPVDSGLPHRIAA